MSLRASSNKNETQSGLRRSRMKSGTDILLLLDLDDTLLDNTNADLASFKYALDKIGVRCPEANQIVGWRKEGMLARTILQKILDCDKNSIMSCMANRATYLNGIKSISHLRLRPDAKNALDLLSEQCTILVITARHKKSTVNAILNKVGISKYISQTLCGEDYSNNPIDPAEYAVLKEALYSMAKKIFGVESKQCVVIGNLRSDIEPAHYICSTGLIWI